jgi:hypothetical protein
MIAKNLIEIRKEHKKPELVTLAQALNWIAFKLPPVDLAYEKKYPIAATDLALEQNRFADDLKLAELQLLAKLRCGALIAEGFKGADDECIKELAADHNLENALQEIPRDAWDSPTQIDWEVSAIQPEITLVDGEIFTTLEEYVVVRLRVNSLEEVFPANASEKPKTAHYNHEKITALVLHLIDEAVKLGQSYTRDTLFKRVKEQYPHLATKRYYQIYWPLVPNDWKKQGRRKNIVETSPRNVTGNVS